ncbi:MAG: tyrosine-type recombinase/integrase, partial [Hyphomicrobiaceae bacterium]
MWDTNFSSGGFGIRVSYGGTKTFILKYQNKRYSLGRYPYVTLKSARQEAFRRIALKYVPKPASAVPDLIETYLDQQRHRIRPGSFFRFNRHLRQHFPFRGDLNTLTATDIAGYIKPLLPSQQNIAFSVIKAFLNWCVAGNHLDKNPLLHLRLPHKKSSRERTLTDDELRQVLRNATSDEPFHLLLTLLAYTGQRRNQIAFLKWAYVSQGAITWPPEDMKGSIQHTIPAGPHVQAILDRLPRTGEYVLGNRFINFDYAKKRFDERVPLKHWTLHDLRRTLVTKWAAIGIKQ